MLKTGLRQREPVCSALAILPCQIHRCYTILTRNQHVGFGKNTVVCCHIRFNFLHSVHRYDGSCLCSCVSASVCLLDCMCMCVRVYVGVFRSVFACMSPNDDAEHADEWQAWPSICSKIPHNTHTHGSSHMVVFACMSMSSTQMSDRHGRLCVWHVHCGVLVY